MIIAENVRKARIPPDNFHNPDEFSLQNKTHPYHNNRKQNKFQEFFPVFFGNLSKKRKKREDYADYEFNSHN